MPTCFVSKPQILISDDWQFGTKLDITSLATQLSGSTNGIDCPERSFTMSAARRDYSPLLPESDIVSIITRLVRRGAADAWEVIRELPGCN